MNVSNLSGAGWDFSSIQNPHSHLFGAPWESFQWLIWKDQRISDQNTHKACGDTFPEFFFNTQTMFSVTTNTSESQVHLMLVSSSAHTQPTILQLMASLDSDFLLESTTCSCPSHWWWLGFPWCPRNKQVWVNVWIELVIQTLPLVTALRKKGSSFPANLANSSYFSRPVNWEFFSRFHCNNLTSSMLDRVRHDLVGSASCSKSQPPLGHLDHKS